MIIKFFKKDEGFDPDAVKPGVYIISLGRANDSASFKPLYVGESYSMAERCGRHLFKLYTDPSYFGFRKEWLSFQQLCMTFETSEILEDNQRDVRKIREKETIKRLSPLIQYPASDHVLPNREIIMANFINGLNLQ